jgi:hypothetical protein
MDLGVAVRYHHSRNPFGDALTRRAAHLEPPIFSMDHTIGVCLSLFALISVTGCPRPFSECSPDDSECDGNVAVRCEREGDKKVGPHKEQRRDCGAEGLVCAQTRKTARCFVSLEPCGRIEEGRQSCDGELLTVCECPDEFTECYPVLVADCREDPGGRCVDGGGDTSAHCSSR